MKSTHSNLLRARRHVVTAAILSLATFGAAATAAPLTVRPIRGQYCSAYGPQGWFVRGENAQRVAFGADLSSGDGLVAAAYAVFAGGPITGVRGMETPERAVATNITQMGTVQTRFGYRRQLAPNIFLIEYENSGFHGVAFYEVFSAGPSGFTIVMRQAGTVRNAWPQRAGEATAVARSLHCHVPMVPAAPDPPSLNGSNRGGKKSNESDTYYNQWLDKEYYHNSETGENYWVSPSTDWHETGPNGPGYYAQHGNSYIKLDPGYSQ